MKCSLGISNFPEEISTLSHLFLSSVSLHWSLKKAFLSLLVILWNSAFRWLYLSFPPLHFIFFFSQLFVRPPQTAILLFCISFPWENIKKRCQEYTEELYEKDLHDQDNHDGVITHLEPDILEYEIKWALESIATNKASGGDGIPVELFQILKDDAVKVLHLICQQIWKTQQWPQDWKRSLFISIPKNDNATECSNYHTIALISHASKVMLKILQARLQQYVNCELLDVPSGFRKCRGTRDQITNIHWIIRKAREF